MNNDDKGFWKFIGAALGGLVLLMFAIGYGINNTNEKNTTNPTVVTIEGCEYFSLTQYYGYVTLTHKGNCSNPIHKNKERDK